MTNIHTEGLWFIQPEHVIAAKFIPRPLKQPKTIRQIQIEECHKAGITLEEMLGQRRMRKVARPRMIAMARCYEELQGVSLPKIGLAFGGRDHTTVLHAVRVVNELGLLDGAN
jgi:chromosomal replication initiation ATPase DnaA